MIILNGYVELNARDKLTGEVLQHSENSNMIVNTGTERTAKLLGGLSNTYFDYMAVGDSNAAVTVTDTDLISCVASEQVANADRTYVDNYKARWTHTFTNFTETHEIYEIGIFDAQSSGTMLARDVLSTGVWVNPSVDLEVQYTITVSNTTTEEWVWAATPSTWNEILTYSNENVSVDDTTLNAINFFGAVLNPPVLAKPGGNELTLFYFAPNNTAPQLYVNEYNITSSSLGTRHSIDTVIGSTYGNIYEPHIQIGAAYDKYGYVWTVYGGHANANYPVKFIRSATTVGSTSWDHTNDANWNSAVEIENTFDSAYPRIWTTPDNWYLLVLRKGNEHTDVYISTDMGDTWNDNEIWTAQTKNYTSIQFYNINNNRTLIFGNHTMMDASGYTTNVGMFWYTAHDRLGGLFDSTKSLTDVENSNYTYTTPVSVDSWKANAPACDVELRTHFDDGTQVLNRPPRKMSLYDPNLNRAYVFGWDLKNARKGTLFYKTLGTPDNWTARVVVTDQELISAKDYALTITHNGGMIGLFNYTTDPSGSSSKTLYYTYVNDPINDDWIFTKISDAQAFYYEYRNLTVCEAQQPNNEILTDFFVFAAAVRTNTSTHYGIQFGLFGYFDNR